MPTDAFQFYKTHTPRERESERDESEPKPAFYPFILYSQFIQELENFGCTFQLLLLFFVARRCRRRRLHRRWTLPR